LVPGSRTPAVQAGSRLRVGLDPDRAEGLEVAIKVIVELKARPGGRTELKQWLETLVVNHGPGQVGFVGSTRYEVLDDPDMLIEIADWESAEARSAHMQESAASGVYAPLAEMLAAPVRATVICEIP
jgi:quinol monooxygenase YgiN